MGIGQKLFNLQELTSIALAGIVKVRFLLLVPETEREFTNEKPLWLLSLEFHRMAER
jgi:hypothetical protein